MENPPLPSEEGLDKVKGAELRYSALLEMWKQERAADIAATAERWKLTQQRLDADLASENALRAAVHGAYLEVAKAALDRSLQRATFVTGAAGTMATIYSGLLALVYSISKEGASPMPASGIGAAAFLGLSLVLSTVYVAFINRSIRAGRHLRKDLGPVLQERRLATFLEWSIGSSFRRAWALRMSVLSLGVGVALTPVPFLALTERLSWGLIELGTGILIATVVYEWIAAGNRSAAGLEATRRSAGRWAPAAPGATAEQAADDLVLGGRFTYETLTARIKLMESQAEAVPEMYRLAQAKLKEKLSPPGEGSRGHDVPRQLDEAGSAG